MSPGLRVRELSSRGIGAVRVLALSGPGALERVRRLAPRARLVPGHFTRAELRTSAGELLDEAIVSISDEQALELHVHGAPALVERLLSELGAVPEDAPPSTIEEQAEALLASAASEAAARMLLDQAEGALRRELEAWIHAPAESSRDRLSALVERGRVARALVRPPLVVLAGPVNAGKSTLFNVLVGRERAVVDAAAGTTRDPVRERARLGAYSVDLVDTAGERDLEPERGDGAIERAGQTLAHELAGAADLVLWLQPDGAGPASPPRASTDAPRRIVLASRVDQPSPALRQPSLSALRDPNGARRVVERIFHEALELPREPWQSGAGVPFLPAWTERLAAGRARGERAELLEDVRAWLAR